MANPSTRIISIFTSLLAQLSHFPCFLILVYEALSAQVASEAAMRAPEEVFRAQQAGAAKAPQELSREDRTRLRAKKKRAGKKRKLQEVGTLPRASSCKLSSLPQDWPC